MRKSIWLVSGVAIGALSLTGWSPPAWAAAGLAGKSADRVIALATAAAKSKGSVHTVETIFNGTQTFLSVLDTSRSEGREVDSGGGDNGTILVISGVAYVRGNAAYLMASENIPQAAASLYAGRWISYHAGDPGYSLEVQDETLATGIADATPVGPLVKTGSKTVDGQSTLGISGGLSGPTAAESTGSETLFVADQAPYLPVELVRKQSVAQLHKSFTVTAKLSHWHERVSLSAPTNPTPISTVLAATG
jgi:hypothetical protein